MTGYEYFEQVLKNKGLKPFDVSKATGIRSGVFSDWKAGRLTMMNERQYGEVL